MAAKFWMLDPDLDIWGNIFIRNHGQIFLLTIELLILLIPFIVDYKSNMKGLFICFRIGWHTSTDNTLFNFR